MSRLSSADTNRMIQHKRKQYLLDIVLQFIYYTIKVTFVYYDNFALSLLIIL